VEQPLEPLFGWPRAGDRGALLLLAGAFTLLWIVVYGGASLASRWVPWRLRAHMDWELGLPFVPEAGLAYLSLNLLLPLLLLVFRRWQDLLPVTLVMSAQTLVAGACFLLLPVADAFPEPVVAGLAGAVFALADRLNLERNYLPSLHVAFAVTSALAIGKRAGAAGAALFLLWAAAIAVATMLLHQHYLADVLAGAAVAGITMAWLHERARAPALARAVRVEALCLADVHRFGRRHVRYLLVAALVYWHSLGAWRRRRPIRVGFCFLQHVDDLLDGHRPCAGEPADLVDALLVRMERGTLGDGALDALARCLWDDVAAFTRDGDDPRGEILALIRLMRRDRIRARGGLLLGEAELREHLRLTFDHAVNLMLMLGGAEARARDVPALVEAFGWCSTVRDLADDLAHGLVNVPSPVIAAARAVGVAFLTEPALLRAEPFRAWLRAEHERAVAELGRADAEIAAIGSRSGSRILRLFHRSIAGWAARLSRRPDWPMPHDAHSRRRQI
jgi:membrane-associated phospholipid phosphatase